MFSSIVPTSPICIFPYPDAICHDDRAELASSGRLAGISNLSTSYISTYAFPASPKQGLFTFSTLYTLRTSPAPNNKWYYKAEIAVGGRSCAICTTTLPMLVPDCRCSTASATASKPLSARALTHTCWRLATILLMELTWSRLKNLIEAIHMLEVGLVILAGCLTQGRHSGSYLAAFNIRVAGAGQ